MAGLHPTASRYIMTSGTNLGLQATYLSWMLGPDSFTVLCRGPLGTLQRVCISRQRRSCGTTPADRTFAVGCVFTGRLAMVATPDVKAGRRMMEIFSSPEATPLELYTSM